MISRRPNPGIANVVCILFVLLFSLAPASAQLTTSLVQFTNLWKYDDSGAELGNAWRTNDFNDSTWPEGQGLLGFEDNLTPYLVHAPLGTSIFPSMTTTSFYFRARFNFNGSTAGLVLVSSNLVDDGCVLYLNGLRVGGVRAPATYNATTFFQGPATEGQLDVVTFTNLSALRQGPNLLACEVHQSLPQSADLMWGMRLTAFAATSLSIVTQPISQTVVVGDSVMLNVAVSGGPAFHQWQKDGVNIGGATNGSAIFGSPASSYSIPQVFLSSSGEYRVIITNALGSVTSEVARLTVVDDLSGPRLVSAILNDPTLIGINSSNTVRLRFNEPALISLASNSVRNPANYHLIPATNPSIRIVITNVLYNSLVQALLFPDVRDENWSSSGSYYLVVNNVADSRGNVIAPNSSIAVLTPHSTNLVSLEDSWSFHSTAWIDPQVYELDWMSAGFVEGSWWAHGNGPFSGGASPDSSCLGMFNTETGFQIEPTLYRSTFHWPTNWPSSALLRLGLTFDDGVVLYFNGRDIWQTNVSAATVSRVTRANTSGSFCFTNLMLWVTNLNPGINYIAAAVVQPGTGVDGDSAFGLRMEGIALISPALAEELPPHLAILSVGPDTVRLGWSGGGYALESTTNLNGGVASYPLGPWQEVPLMSNPYTNSLEATPRFFRLKK